MPPATTHPLLERLLRKVGADDQHAPRDEAWRELLPMIARTFNASDQDRYTLERSIDISSREMQGLYQDLKQRTDSELAVERYRVEESLAIMRATLEATTEGILIADKERRVVAANKKYAEQFAIPDDVLATKDHRAVLAYAAKSFDDPAAHAGIVEHDHATNETRNDELTVRDRVIARHTAPVMLPDGQQVGRVTFFRDVTDERAASEALERARADAEAASHAKSMFLANMSHELRTPLNAVIGLADLLLLEGGEPLSARQREYLDGILTSGRHLLAMVNDVLDLAKIEAGKHHFGVERVVVDEAVGEAVQLLQPLAATRGVALAAALTSGLPDLAADPVRLRQILYNLISNAVKFTDRNGRVDVSTEASDGGVLIRVADTGIGIATANMNRLFRAFEQLDMPSGDRPAGTGLGLALTKRLVDMHGGSLDVTSRLGAGTTFTVKLPVM